MNDLLNKLSSYNLFNFLLPGVISAYLIDAITPYRLLPTDFVIGAFVSYFIGMIISRVGSLIVEPLLKHLGVAKFANYPDYIEASKNDEKIVLFSEVNNTYRTILAMFVFLLIVKLYSLLESQLLWLVSWRWLIALILGIILFVASYRKQVGYIKQRVDHFINSTSNSKKD